MKRSTLVVVFAVVFGVSCLAGCGSAKKKPDELTGIKTRVETLESRLEGVEAKQAETERAASEQGQALEEMRSRGSDHSNFTTKVRPGKVDARIKDIQACLKSAGYYQGKIDGVKGKSTKKAIKAFQKANGLKADGVVGPKTWQLLSKYSSGAAGGAE